MTDSQPKKVLIIESGEGVGGSAFSMFRIVKYLDKSKYQPSVFVYFRAKSFADIEKLGVPVTILPIYSPFPRKLLLDDSLLKRIANFVSLYGNLFIETLFNGFQLARIIRRNRIDIVHCNNGFFENFSAVFAARITGTPCVSHIRGTEPIMKIERHFHHWLRKIIVLNREMLDAYTVVFGANKVHLIYNGVDLDLFHDQDPKKIRDEFSIGDESFCVGTFARVVEGKGIPEFLQAAARAGETHRNLVFFVAGGTAQDSAFESEMRALAMTLDLGGRVIFTGWRDDVRDFMSAMDLVLQVSTTYPEGMSLAPIEAMALSKPVIVTDNPGYANIVKHDSTGFVVPMGDIETLAALIKRLADNRDLARSLGEHGRQRVLDVFEYGIVARHVEEIYAQLLASNGLPQ